MKKLKLTIFLSMVMVLFALITKGQSCNAYFTIPPAYTNIIPFTDSSSVDSVSFPIQHIWDFGDGAMSFDPNPAHAYAGAGNYTVCLQVIFSNNCMDTFCQQITVDSAVVSNCGSLLGSASVQDANNTNCNNGEIVVTAYGGTPPYTYSINGGAYQNSNIFTGLWADYYDICIIDANGCGIILFESVNCVPDSSVNSCLSLAGTLTITEATYSTCNDGVVEVFATGGTPPYTYSIDGVTYQSSNVFNNVVSGTYNVCVFDSLGCGIFVPGVVNCGPDTANNPCLGFAVVGSPYFATDSTCSNGRIEVITGNGTAPFTYSIDGVNFQTSEFFNNLSGTPFGTGTPYQITVRDSFGCEEQSMTLMYCQPGAPSGNCNFIATTDVVDADNAGCDNGIITVFTQNGTPPYTYSLDGVTYQNSNVFTNVTNGFYNICVFDSFGCGIFIPALVNCTPDSLVNNCGTLAGTATVTDATDSSLCTDGFIDVLATGGTPPYTYSIDGVTYQTSNQFSNLTPGFYNVCVFDSLGCGIFVPAHVNCNSDSAAPCVDVNLIDTNVVCPLLNIPVCGCDGITYNNACEAVNWNGVLGWTPGACGTVVPVSCIDTSLIDNTVVCPTVIDPVCGCDNVTYNNACEAANVYGVPSWTPGACNADVWPGDCDNDFTVNNFDLLPVGLSYGNFGPVRPNATINWNGQFAQNWATGVNFVNDKHADSNGDGFIDTLDLQAILQNYGQVHAKTGETKTGTGPELIPNFLGVSTFAAGSTVSATIDYGNVDTPVNNLYGIAYTIEYDPAIIVDSTIQITTDAGWFGGGGNNLLLYKVFSAPGRIEVAQTKTDHYSRSGFGSIAQISYVIQEDLAGKTNLEHEMTLRITNVKAINHEGHDVNVKTNMATATVEGSTSIENLANQVGVYPNPTNGKVYINTGGIEVLDVVVTNLIGQQVSVAYNKTANSVDFENNQSGVYFILIKTIEGEVLKKVMLK